MSKRNFMIVIAIAWLTYWVIGMFTEDYIDFDSVDSKNIVITGASSGIGEQLAYVYAQHGANVFITARRGDLLAKVAEKCKHIGKPNRKFTFVAADMNEPEDRKMVIDKALSDMGDIDQLIINHAQMPKLSKWTGSDDNMDDLQKIMNVNTLAPAHLTALALPSLRRTAGSIGVVGSGSGRLPTPYTVEYVASKFALDGFFSGLRYEFKANGENVSITHCILGLIETEAGAKSLDTITDYMSKRGQFLFKMMQPVDAAGTARAIISATTRRQGELYYPPVHMLWQFGIIRAIVPEMERLDIAGFFK